MDTKKKTVFYDKLTFIYLEMPKFNKGVDELATRFEKWMYVLKKYRDLNSAIETAKMEGEVKGKIEGEIKGKMETALKMLEDGMSIESICKYTGLSEEQVKELIKSD